MKLVYRGKPQRRYIPKFGWVQLSEETPEDILFLARSIGIEQILDTDEKMNVKSIIQENLFENEQDREQNQPRC